MLMEQIGQFYVGDIVTSLKLSLSTEGEEIVVAGTLNGSIRAFIPVGNRRKSSFLQKIELLMRDKHDSLLGNDHYSYRSSYLPCKAIIDSDFCGGLASFPPDTISDLLAHSSFNFDETKRFLVQTRSQIV